MSSIQEMHRVILASETAEETLPRHQADSMQTARSAPAQLPSQTRRALKPPLHPDTLRRLRSAKQPAVRPSSQAATAARQAQCKAARALYAARKYASAEPLLVAYLRKYPRDIDATLDLANCLQLQAKHQSRHAPFPEVSELLGKAMALNPQKPGQRTRLGSALTFDAWHAHLLGQPTGFGLAVPYLQQAVANDPRNPHFKELLGACMAAALNDAAAEQLFAEARELHDRLPLSHMRHRAFALDMQGRHAEAESCYREILRQTPADASMQGELGVNLVQHRGPSPEAVQLLQEALRAFPKSKRYLGALMRARQPKPQTWADRWLFRPLAAALLGR